MPRSLARRRLLAVGLSLALTTPILGGSIFTMTAAASDRNFVELRLRDTGPRVKLAQRTLDVKPRTGYFNKETRHHVKRFQDKRDFAVTGVINERTMKALRNRWEAIQDRRARIDRKYDKFMEVARNQKGDPYVFGADGPNAFDCSGLILFAFEKATGRTLQHSATAQARAGERIKRKNARPGDLVIFHNGGDIYHSGIFAGRNRVLHASRPGTNVKTDPIWTNKVYFVRLMPKS